MGGRLWLLLVLMVMAGCAASDADDRPTPPISAEEAAALVKQTKNLPAVADGSNAFACDFYRALAKEREGNLIFSPAGVAITLAMAEAGARGETAEQIAAALHQKSGTESNAAAWGALLSVMRSERQAPVNQLKVANRLWVQSGYPLLDAYKQITGQEFGAEIGVIDFGSPADAAARINHWAGANTNGLIPDALPASALSADTRLVLMNAIYLLAKWEHPFEDGTHQDSFFAGGTDRIDVSMMSQMSRFRYAEREDLQLVELEYRGGDLSMIVVLPKEKEGLPSVEADFTAVKLNNLLGDAKAQLVELHLPKFKLSESIDLNQSLTALGMRAALDPDEADFSGISEKQRERNLYISAALQKALIQVDEEGTEAAAVTEFAITEKASEAVEGDSPPIFRADHPFTFFVRDNLTGTLLFAGRVVDPRDQ